MKSSLVLLAFATVNGALALGKCNADDCFRGINGAHHGDEQQMSRQTDCASLLMQNVTPESYTKTLTAYTTCPDPAPTSTITLPCPLITCPSVLTPTYPKTVRITKTKTIARITKTVTKTCKNKHTPHLAGRDFAEATAYTAPTASSETPAITGSMPDYASFYCPAFSAYSSACSCIITIMPTSTAARPTVTVWEVKE